MAQHLLGRSPELTDASRPDQYVEPSSSGTVTIDCATCVMRETPACDDCVVTFLCDRDPTDAVMLDLAERQALRRLAQAGLAPRLRHVGP
jgi:hypothetical protein